MGSVVRARWSDVTKWTHYDSWWHKRDLFCGWSHCVQWWGCSAILSVCFILLFSGRVQFYWPADKRPVPYCCLIWCSKPLQEGGLSRSSLPSFIGISCTLYRSLWCRKYIYIWWVLGKLSWHTVMPFHFHFSSVSGHYVMKPFIPILSWSWTVICFTVLWKLWLDGVSCCVFVCACGGGGLLFSTNLPVIVVSLETCFCQQKIKAAESSLGLEILPICRLPASKPVNSALWTGTGSAC